MPFRVGTTFFPTEVYTSYYQHRGPSENVVKMKVTGHRNGTCYFCERYYGDGKIEEGFIQSDGHWHHEIYLRQGMWREEGEALTEQDYEEMV